MDFKLLNDKDRLVQIADALDAAERYPTNTIKMSDELARHIAGELRRISKERLGSPWLTIPARIASALRRFLLGEQRCYTVSRWRN